MDPALAGAGMAGRGAGANREFAGSAALSVALHAGLVVAIILAPQVFRPRFHEVPTLGPIFATLEGTGGVQRSGGGATRPVAVPLPAQPAPPPTKAIPAPPRPAPTDDLTIPRAGKARPPREVVAKRDDLRPDFAPIRKQATPTPPPPAPSGPRTAATVPGPLAAGAGAGPGSVDVDLKTAGGVGGPGIGVSPLLYYFARIQDKVSAYWSPTALPGEREVLVLVGIRVQANGQVRDISVETSSGDRSFDDAAVRALRQALPLPPFPLQVKEQSMNLILKFSNKGFGG